MALAKEVVNQTGAMREFEKPEVCEAIKVANANRWTVALSPTEWDERKARLKKEYEKNTKSPGSGEDQPEEKIRIICCSALPKADFYYKHVLNEGNPALKESASQFNDALLDEQAKEIESLRDKCKKYADILDSVGDKLRELKAENRRIKDSDLNLEGLTYATRELKEKNKEIAELTEENERLKDQVAVLYACKENNEKYNLKQIKRLGKEIAKLNGIIHDKNAVLADVAEELRLSKIREKNLTEVGQKYMKENEELKKLLADKVGNGVDWKRNADAIKLYVNRASHERLWNPINQDICNEKELSFIINHGGKRVKYALRFDGTDIVYECSDPDKKPRIPISEESREDFIKKTIDNYNRIAANLGCVGSKGGNGIIDQMVGADVAAKGADIIKSEK